MTEKEVIFEGDLLKIFGERPFSKEIAESKKVTPKEKDKTSPKGDDKPGSKEEDESSPKDKGKDSSKEEIAEENSK